MYYVSQEMDRPGSSRGSCEVWHPFGMYESCSLPLSLPLDLFLVPVLASSEQSVFLPHFGLDKCVHSKVQWFCLLSSLFKQFFPNQVAALYSLISCCVRSVLRTFELRTFMTRKSSTERVTHRCAEVFCALRACAQCKKPWTSGFFLFVCVRSHYVCPDYVVWPGTDCVHNTGYHCISLRI